MIDPIGRAAGILSQNDICTSRVCELPICQQSLDSCLIAIYGFAFAFSGHERNAIGTRLPKSATCMGKDDRTSPWTREFRANPMSLICVQVLVARSDASTATGPIMILDLPLHLLWNITLAERSSVSVKTC